MKLVSKKYLLPFILITSLFFMWGFARAILDVLNKHFQSHWKSPSRNPHSYKPLHISAIF